MLKGKVIITIPIWLEKGGKRQGISLLSLTSLAQVKELTNRIAYAYSMLPSFSEVSTFLPLEIAPFPVDGELYKVIYEEAYSKIGPIFEWAHAGISFPAEILDPFTLGLMEETFIDGKQYGKERMAQFGLNTSPSLLLVTLPVIPGGVKLVVRAHKDGKVVGISMLEGIEAERGVIWSR